MPAPTVERVATLGWLARLTLRLAGGETLVAHVPHDELHGAKEGDGCWVDLRNPKAFLRPETATDEGASSSPEEAPASMTVAAGGPPPRTAGGRPDLPLDGLRFAELPEERRRLLLHVHELLDSIAYGTVVLVVHDGRVLQIETSEKIRLRDPQRRGESAVGRLGAPCRPPSCSGPSGATRARARRSTTSPTGWTSWSATRAGTTRATRSSPRGGC